MTDEAGTAGTLLVTGKRRSRVLAANRPSGCGGRGIREPGKRAVVTTGARCFEQIGVEVDRDGLLGHGKSVALGAARFSRIRLYDVRVAGAHQGRVQAGGRSRLPVADAPPPRGARGWDAPSDPGGSR